MTRLAVTLAAGTALYGSSIIAGPSAAMPVSYLTTLGASADVQTVANECRRYPCWGWSAYYDTPPHLRPRVFYGYAPHRDGDWFRYFYGRDGYIYPWDSVGYRKNP